MFITNLNRRSHAREWMDDLTIQDHRLTDALGDLLVINRLLGGYSTSFNALSQLVANARRTGTLSILDIGCGGGDFAIALLQWATVNANEVDVRVTAVDISPATIDWAVSRSQERLPLFLQSKVSFLCCDAFHLPFVPNSFDIAHASLFTHHFCADGVVLLIREMDRVARAGIIVNDLHRHRVALASINALTRAFRASPMVQHDGPLSVRRGFTSDEICRIASASGIGSFKLSWHWAFRWLLTTVGSKNV